MHLHILHQTGLAPSTPWPWLPLDVEHTPACCSCTRRHGHWPRSMRVQCGGQPPAACMASPVGDTAKLAHARQPAWADKMSIHMEHHPGHALQRDFSTLSHVRSPCSQPTTEALNISKLDLHMQLHWLGDLPATAPVSCATCCQQQQLQPEAIQQQPQSQHIPRPRGDITALGGVTSTQILRRPTTRWPCHRIKQSCPRVAGLVGVPEQQWHQCVLQAAR